MLVESLIQGTVDLQGFRIDSVAARGNGLLPLIATIVPDKRFYQRCGGCGQPASYRRVACERCDGILVERMPWVAGKRRMTKVMSYVLAHWARILPWMQVARLFGVAWGTVSDAVEEAVQYGLAHQDLSDLTHIGIDEISRKRGCVYVTNVYDLRSKRLVWSGEGRKQETLEAFFPFLGKERTKTSRGSAVTCGNPTSMPSKPTPLKPFSCSTNFMSFDTSRRPWTKCAVIRSAKRQ